MSDNPFEVHDLDPRDGPGAITTILRAKIEDAPDDATRDRIRAAWQELTMHPETRLRAALTAHPETRAPLGLPPVAPGAHAPPPRFADLDVDAFLFVQELLTLVGLTAKDAEEPPPEPLSADPLLRF